jgi:hypothetical protein
MRMPRALEGAKYSRKCIFFTILNDGLDKLNNPNTANSSRLLAARIRITGD